MEAKGEERSPTLPPPSSSSSCSSEEVEVKEETEKDPDKDAGDDGYHTPTSPRRRIPEVGRCPPAPRKPAPSLHAKRRKVRARQAGRRVDVEGEIGSFWSAELAVAGPKTKKARGGEAANA